MPPPPLACLGGTWTANETLCTCSPDFRHDNLVLLQTNCAMPKALFPLVLSLSGIMSVLVLGMAGFLLVRVKVKADSRKSLIFVVLTQLANLGGIAAYATDDYASPGAWACMLLCCMFVMASITIVMRAFFRVSCSVLGATWSHVKVRMDVAFALMFLLGFVAFFIAFMASVMYGTRDPAKNNEVVVWFLLLLPAHELGPVLYFSQVPTYLIRVAEEMAAEPSASAATPQTPTSTKTSQAAVKNFTKRLRFLRNCLLTIIPCVSGTCFLAAGLYLGMGNVPFLFIFWCGCELVWPALGAVFCYFAYVPASATTGGKSTAAVRTDTASNNTAGSSPPPAVATTLSTSAVGVASVHA